MEQIHRILTYRLTTRDAAGRFGQIACYIAALAILVLGFHKLNALASGLDEAQLFFGVLLVLVTGLLMICLGTLTRVAAMWTHTHAVNVRLEETDG